MSPVSASTLAATDRLRQRFAPRAPFRHLVVDEFFEPAFAAELLASFPPFAAGDARNEAGALGGKAVVEQIRELGPAWAAVDDLVRGQPFLDWLSTVTGIPALLYDPYYFGGGTHENRHGQELDAHIDFNRHPANGWHRRLNLIVYLNPEWQADWGGSLELLEDPRRPGGRIEHVLPLFNRCVLFETTEHSWHGFSKIRLPAERADLSRRSLALYFYTRARPAEETAPTHSTVYVDRPLPAHFAAGHRLSEADVHELQELLTRRDMHLQRLYGEVSALQARIEHVTASGGHLRRGLSAAAALARLATTRQRFDRAAIKSALTPFVRELPAGLREPLRRLWRRASPSER